MVSIKKIAYATGLGILLLLCAGMIFAYHVQQYLYSPVSSNEAELYFEVKKGSGFSQVARALQREGLILHPFYWQLLARAKDQAHQIKSGEYRLSFRSSPAEILQKLVNGQVVLHQLTVVEGVTFAEFWRRVHEHPAIDHLLQDPHELQLQLNLPSENPEGWFMPDTYTFSRGTSDVEIFRQSYQLMQDYLAAAWSERSQGLPYETPYEALIMASIIEKETGAESERALIAGVFTGRLRKGMKLQTDPTVIYGIGKEFDGNIRKQDLSTNTPYNTYVHAGLPPTPICLVSRASIQAALHPVDTDYLYFVSRGDGTHFFSENYDDHLAAVREFQLQGSP